MICRHVHDCTCSRHRVNLCEYLITIVSDIDADGHIFHRAFFCYSLFYIEGYAQLGGQRKNGQWWPGPMARFSPLHIFIARIDNLTPNSRSMEISYIWRERYYPWFKEPRPSWNPCESIHIEYELSERFTWSIREIVLRALRSAGCKLRWRKQRDNPIGVPQFLSRFPSPSLQLITIISGDATSIESLVERCILYSFNEESKKIDKIGSIQLEAS